MPNIAPFRVDREVVADQVAPAVEIAAQLSRHSLPFVPDSRRAWARLAVAVLIGSLGRVGMWSVVVALPGVQTELAAARGTASLAFTLVMLGFGIGQVVTGKISDRFGIVAAIGIGVLGLGYVGAGLSPAISQYILVLLIGLSSAATFGPLMAEASYWFERYRGLAVAMALALILLRMLMGAGTQSAAMSTRRCHGSTSGFHPRADRHSRLQTGPAAWRCRCRRYISSPIAAISVTAWRASRKCCR